MLKEDTYRTGLSDTPVCEYGNNRESAEHYLLHCTRHHKARSELRDAVDDILESVKEEKHLTERLLLAPYYQSENINRKQDRHIKEALFSSLQILIGSFNFCTINTSFRLSSLDNRYFHSSVILIVELTSEDFTLTFYQRFYSEIDQEVNRRVSAVLDTRRLQTCDY